MVGLGFTWKLFDGGAAASEAAALRARSRAERQRRADLRSRIELAVRAAWLQLAAARAQIEASRAATAQAAENLRISRELYRVGLASNTQVLEAVTLRAEAERNYDDARLDAGLDRLRLAYAVGAL
jgi:outer membrane protein TolC